MILSKINAILNEYYVPIADIKPYQKAFIDYAKKIGLNVTLTKLNPNHLHPAIANVKVGETVYMVSGVKKITDKNFSVTLSVETQSKNKKENLERFSSGIEELKSKFKNLKVETDVQFLKAEIPFDVKKP